MLDYIEKIFITCNPSSGYVASEIFPEGLKIQEKRGARELQPLLLKFKRYKFRGYVKITLRDQLEGYIILKEGMPLNALLITPSGKKLLGLEALQKIQSLDQIPELCMEVHTDIDVDVLSERIPGKLPPMKDDYHGIYAKIQEDDLKEIIEEELVEEQVKEKRERYEAKREIEEKIKEAEREDRESMLYVMALRGVRGEKGMEVGVFTDKYTYDNFVVGPNNKFAYAAAKEVSRNPGGQFNPLFITSPAGLGKTHLLKAIGYYLTRNRPEFKVEYNTTVGLASEITQNKDAEDILHTRNRCSALDVMLLDDVQFLADREVIQEELFYIFNEIMDRGGQIVLSCDRQPENIPALEDRLISRFKSGLMVDIGRPSYETRLGVVDKILEEHRISLDDEIRSYIAKNITKNIREIEGGVNRVLAFSSLLKQEITMEMVKEMLGKQRGRDVYVGDGKSGPDFCPGHCYIIKDEGHETAFRLLRNFTNERKMRIHVFSRMNPNWIRDNMGIEGGNVLWLTGRSSTEHETVPPNLEGLTWRIEEILDQDSVILLDGIEYLAGTSGFDATLQFIRHLVDCVSETGCILLLPIKPETFDKKEMSLLEREMEEVHS